MDNNEEISNGENEDMFSEEIPSGSNEDEASAPLDNSPVLTREYNNDTCCNENDYDDIGEFYFESDHLALKGNMDYHRLLKTLSVLEAQRVQAVKDLDTLFECQKKALEDPIDFVEKLQQKEDLGIPKPQCIAAVPTIDWGQYALTGSHLAFTKRQLTRLSTRASADNSSKQDADSHSKSEGKTLRKRPIVQEDKSATFNQPWTAEEQKRLEELLIKYPPEEIESRRWEKVANALGNRTTTQVASRVQKYFIKLARAGLPIPGRPPNISNFKKSRRLQPTQNSSTFLVSLRPPVFMSEVNEGFDSSNYFSAPSSTCDDGNLSDDMDVISDEDNIDVDLHDTEEFQELLRLKKARKDKISSQGLAQHIGYKCDRCECEPITGTRWHCTDCVPDSVDFCSDCMDCVHETDKHKPEHHLEPVYHANDIYIDSDYMQFSGSDYNYLDPNYMPAV